MNWKARCFVTFLSPVLSVRHKDFSVSEKVSAASQYGTAERERKREMFVVSSYSLVLTAFLVLSFEQSLK